MRQGTLIALGLSAVTGLLVLSTRRAKAQPTASTTPVTTTTATTSTTPDIATPPPPAVEYARIPAEGAIIYETGSDTAMSTTLSGSHLVEVLQRRPDWVHVRIVQVTKERRTPWPTFWVRPNALVSAEPPATPMTPTTPGEPTPTPAPIPNMIGCTPLTSTIPQSAIDQADALLRLKSTSTNPTEVATIASVTAMRKLADAIAYCGGPDEWTLRDLYVQRLRAHASALEPTLPAF